MRFSAPTALLTEASGYAASVAAAKSPKRVLECLAIRASKKDGVTIEATDLDVAVRLKLADATVEEDGAIVVPAARLVSVLREISEKSVTLVGTEGRLEIDTSDCHFRVNGDDPADFPVLPQFPASGAFQVGCGILRGMVRRTVFATAKEPGRFALHGVLMRCAKGQLEMVGTDGRRLARATHAIEAMKGDGKTAEGKGEVKVIVGAKALSLLDRLAADDAAPVEVALEERQILFRAGGTLLASRLIDGAFPSYEEVIPKPSKRGFSAPAGDLATALRRASLLTTKDAKSVTLDFAPKRLTLSSRAAEVGEAKIELKIDYDDAAERLGFDPSFLLDALKVMEPTSPVRFEFTTGKSPGKLSDGEGYSYVVMPVSIE
jgi:DNA polymerase-3 subunit beta